MATEFQIKKGLSSQLFNPDGSCKLSKLVENCWYLTTDTAEVYVALKQEDESLQLKHLNDTDIDFKEFDTRLQVVENDNKLHTYEDKSKFPVIGIDNHMYIALKTKKTYVYINDSYISLDSDYGEI